MNIKESCHEDENLNLSQREIHVKATQPKKLFKIEKQLRPMNSQIYFGEDLNTKSSQSSNQIESTFRESSSKAKA